MTRKFVNRLVLFCLYVLVNVFVCNSFAAPAKPAVAPNKKNVAAVKVVTPVKNVPARAIIETPKVQIVQGASNVQVAPKQNLSIVNYKKIPKISEVSTLIIRTFLDYFIQNAIESHIAPLGSFNNLQKDKLLIKLNVNLTENSEWIGFFSSTVGMQFLRKDSVEAIDAEKAGLFNKANSLEIKLSPANIQLIYSQKDINKVIERPVNSVKINRQIEGLFGETKVIQDKNYAVIECISFLEDILDLNRSYVARTVLGNPEGKEILSYRDILRDKQQAIYTLGFALSFFVRDRLSYMSDLVYDKLILDYGGSLDQIKKINKNFKRSPFSKESAKKDLFFNLYEKNNKDKLNSMVDNMVIHTKGLVVKCSSESQANEVASKLRDMFDIRKISEKASRQTQEENSRMQQRLQGIVSGNVQLAAEMIAETYERVTEATLNSNFMTEEEISDYNKMREMENANNLVHVLVVKRNLENSTTGHYVYVLLGVNENTSRQGLDLTYLLYSNKFNGFKLDENERKKAKKQIVAMMINKIIQTISSISFSSKEVQFNYSLVNTVTKEEKAIDMTEFLTIFQRDKNIGNIIAGTARRFNRQQESTTDNSNNTEGAKDSGERYFDDEDAGKTDL